MGSDFLRAKVRSIEEEVKVLKAQIGQMVQTEKKPRKFSELEGLWKGKADFSFQDIKDAKIKFKEPRQ